MTTALCSLGTLECIHHDQCCKKCNRYISTISIPYAEAAPRPSSSPAGGPASPAAIIFHFRLNSAPAKNNSCLPITMNTNRNEFSSLKQNPVEMNGNAADRLCSKDLNLNNSRFPRNQLCGYLVVSLPASRVRYVFSMYPK